MICFIIDLWIFVITWLSWITPSNIFFSFILYFEIFQNNRIRSSDFLVIKYAKRWILYWFVLKSKSKLYLNDDNWQLVFEFVIEIHEFSPAVSTRQNHMGLVFNCQKRQMLSESKPADFAGRFVDHLVKFPT